MTPNCCGGRWLTPFPPISEHITRTEPCTEHEIETAALQGKSGRSPGHDGIPGDTVIGLPCLLPELCLIFTVMFRSCVYPTLWGIGLVRSLLKPGKPASSPSSLRGLRLLRSFASLFGRVLDKRCRNNWQAGYEQFGLKSGKGCLEAVTFLIAVVHSRTVLKKRLYVLWVDLRTAFPSLCRSVLIKPLHECGLSLGICRLVAAIFDASYSVACVGRRISRAFKEKLGVREGAVESPHQFNVYISDLRRCLEEEHPNLCRMLGVIIAVLLLPKMLRYQRTRLKTCSARLSFS